MELLQLKYFLAVAKTEHIKATAEEMMVTPPAVSIAISKLEKELGVSLFDRKGRNIVLNNNGRVFMKHIEDMMSSLDEAIKSVKAQSPYSAILQIHSVNPYLWNKPINDFQNRYPDISIIFSGVLDSGMETKPAKDIVKESPSELFIASRDYLSRCDVESEHLFDAQLFIAMSKKHRLAKKKSIDLADLKDEWFINSPHRTDFRRYCDELCMISGFIPNSHIECDYMVRPNIINSETDSVCICTTLGKESGLYEKTALVPMVSPVAKRSYVIAWKPRHTLTPQARLFIDFLKEYYNNVS